MAILKDNEIYLTLDTCLANSHTCKKLKIYQMAQKIADISDICYILISN